jgi:hypothetical protein
MFVNEFKKIDYSLSIIYKIIEKEIKTKLPKE